MPLDWGGTVGEQRAKRKLAAIVAADVVGYSRLTALDEEGTIARLHTLRRELIDPAIANHHGRLVKTSGDGLLVEFASVVDAVRCAVEVQRAMAERGRSAPQDKRIAFRMGINVGDIVIDGDDILGDGVNVAARLEGLAEPGGICVSARVQEDMRGKFDVAFEDIGEQSLKNIALPLRVYRVQLAGTPAPSPTTSRPEKASIAVLPFQNMSGDPEQEYFADGIVEEIITALSRIRWLFVIARNSSFTYKGQSVDVKRVGRELGVSYVLEGSVRKGGGRVRITAQLIDAETGAHLWADRFDGLLEDVFELQDEVAINIAGVIEPTLQAAEIVRSIGRPTDNPGAHDLYLRALPHVFSWEKGQIVQARGLLAQAIDRDPRFGPALALAAFCHHELDVNGWSDDADANRRDGVSVARQALHMAGDDATVLAAGAFVLGYFGEDTRATTTVIDRALTLNPSFARGWVMSGYSRLWVGQPDVAIKHFETALRLNPRDRKAYPPVGIGLALFFERRFDEAVERLLVSLEETPKWTTPYRFLAACYAHMGRLEDARETIERWRSITSAFPGPYTQFQNQEHQELLLSGILRAAGMRSPVH